MYKYRGPTVCGQTWQTTLTAQFWQRLSIHVAVTVLRVQSLYIDITSDIQSQILKTESLYLVATLQTGHPSNVAKCLYCCNRWLMYRHLVIPLSKGYFSNMAIITVCCRHALGCPTHRPARLRYCT